MAKRKSEPKARPEIPKGLVRALAERKASADSEALLTDLSMSGAALVSLRSISTRSSRLRRRCV
jgi:hypothetical protein